MVAYPQKEFTEEDIEILRKKSENLLKHINNEDIASIIMKISEGQGKPLPQRSLTEEDLYSKQQELKEIEGDIAELERKEFSVHRDMPPGGVAPLGKFGPEGRVSGRATTETGGTVYGVQGAKSVYETSPKWGQRYEQLKVKREALLAELQGHEKSINERLLSAKGTAPTPPTSLINDPTYGLLQAGGKEGLKQIARRPTEKKEAKEEIPPDVAVQISALKTEYAENAKIIREYTRSRMIEKGERKGGVMGPPKISIDGFPIDPSEIGNIRRRNIEIGKELVKLKGGGRIPQGPTEGLTTGAPYGAGPSGTPRKGFATIGEGARITGGGTPKGPIPSQGGAGGLKQRKIVRTGTDKATGQKVVMYEDGTTEYIKGAPSAKGNNLTVKEMANVLIKHGIDTKRAEQVVEEMSKQNQAGISVDIDSFKRALQEAGIFLKWSDAELMNIYKSVWGGLSKVGESLLNIKIPGTSQFRNK